MLKEVNIWEASSISEIPNEGQDHLIGVIRLMVDTGMRSLEGFGRYPELRYISCSGVELTSLKGVEECPK